MHLDAMTAYFSHLIGHSQCPLVQKMGKVICELYTLLFHHLLSAQEMV